MLLRRLLLLPGVLLVGGCLWPVRQSTDQAVQDLSSRPFDLAPAVSAEPLKETPKAGETPAAPARTSSAGPGPATDIQTAAYMQAAPKEPGRALPKYELQIPPQVPGSEAPLITFEGLSPQAKARAIGQIYGELPPLPVAPTPLPGPNGQPYTLADLQRLGAENSPTLRQAASDVEAARGALLQAKTYPNPTLQYLATPSNNGSVNAAQGLGVDQVIKTFGKLKLAAAAAQKDLDNAELALRRARSDLSTSIRNAYFGLLVAQEAVRVTRALAQFTDEIYRVYTGYLGGGFAAAYEPAALRAQAYTTRLAYQQAISGYSYAWKQLVASLGLPQLPLSEVAGRVDRLIPYYDYDGVLAHVLSRHTDVLTARSALEKARYNLKAAQIAPYPDVEVNAQVLKEFAVTPNAITPTVTVSVPVPLWDKNKGNIIAAQAALVRAEEESHRVEVSLTNGLAAAYLNYKNNLDALEYYRRHILPDQVRAYRGVFQRRQIDVADLAGTFANLVAAQQALVSGVSAYLGLLGNLWSGAVSVADFLQTDDLFQLARPHELPELPDFEQWPRWLCPHGRLSAAIADGACPPVPAALLGQPIPVQGLEPKRDASAGTEARSASEGGALPRASGLHAAPNPELTRPAQEPAFYATLPDPLPVPLSPPRK
jgi:cobalt-zinc-cadmium efflux system outer membrane protein